MSGAPTDIKEVVGSNSARDFDFYVLLLLVAKQRAYHISDISATRENMVRAISQNQACSLTRSEAMQWKYLHSYRS